MSELKRRLSNCTKVKEVYQRYLKKIVRGGKGL